MDQAELFRIIRKDLYKLEGFMASLDAGEVNSQRQAYGIQIVDKSPKTTESVRERRRRERR